MDTDEGNDIKKFSYNKNKSNDETPKDPTNNNNKNKGNLKPTNINVIANNFVLVKEIGHGAFGEIYLTFNMRDNTQVATKKEAKTNDTTDNKLKTEAVIYQSLLNINKQDLTGANLIIQEEVLGVPKFHGYGETNEYNYLIIEFLGPNLLDLLKMCKKKKYTISTVGLIGLQIMNRIEYLHNKTYIHRDIKPENFVIGTQANSNVIYTIDYGLSKRYKLSKNNQHIPYKEGKPLTGTARYVSINTHFGIEQSRRDDLESIGYILIYFLKGSLPWQGLKGGEKFHSIMEKKLQIPTELLCLGLPEEMTSYLNYCKSLRFEDRPDYEYLRGLFISILGKCINTYGLSKQNLKFDWCFKDQEEIWHYFYKDNKRMSCMDSVSSSSQIEAPILTTNSNHSRKLFKKKTYKETISKEQIKHLTTIKEREKEAHISNREEEKLFLSKDHSLISNKEQIIIMSKSSMDNDDDFYNTSQESDTTQKCSFKGVNLTSIIPVIINSPEEDHMTDHISNIMSKQLLTINNNINTNNSSSSRDIDIFQKKFSLKEQPATFSDNDCSGILNSFERALTFNKAQTPQVVPRKVSGKSNNFEGKMTRLKTIRGGSNCYLHSKLRPLSNVIWDSYTEEDTNVFNNESPFRNIKIKTIIHNQEQKKYSLLSYPKDTVDITIAKTTECCGLLPIKEMIEDTRYSYFIIDLTPKANLFDIFIQYNEYTERQVKEIFISLFTILNNMHVNQLFFRQLTYEDIYVMNDNQVKCANYQICNKPLSKRAYKTIDYNVFSSPEIINDSQTVMINEKNDVWRCGVMLYIILYGSLPIKSNTQDTIIIPNDNNISSSALDLLKSMLQYDQYERYSIIECLNHPWLTENRDDDSHHIPKIQSEKLEKTMCVLYLSNIVNYSIRSKKSLENDLKYITEQDGKQGKKVEEIISELYGENDIKALTKRTDEISSGSEIVNMKRKTIEKVMQKQLNVLSNKNEVMICRNDIINMLNRNESEKIKYIIDELTVNSKNNQISLNECVKCLQVYI